MRNRQLIRPTKACGPAVRVVAKLREARALPINAQEGAIAPVRPLHVRAPSVLRAQSKGELASGGVLRPFASACSQPCLEGPCTQHKLDQIRGWLIAAYPPGCQPALGPRGAANSAAATSATTRVGGAASSEIILEAAAAAAASTASTAHAVRGTIGRGWLWQQDRGKGVRVWVRFGPRWLRRQDRGERVGGREGGAACDPGGCGGGGLCWVGGWL